MPGTASCPVIVVVIRVLSQAAACDKNGNWESLKVNVKALMFWFCDQTIASLGLTGNSATAKKIFWTNSEKFISKYSHHKQIFQKSQISGHYLLHSYLNAGKVVGEQFFRKHSFVWLEKINNIHNLRPTASQCPIMSKTIYRIYSPKSISRIFIWKVETERKMCCMTWPSSLQRAPCPANLFKSVDRSTSVSRFDSLLKSVH